MDWHQRSMGDKQRSMDWPMVVVFGREGVLLMAIILGRIVVLGEVVLLHGVVIFAIVIILGVVLSIVILAKVVILVVVVILPVRVSILAILVLVGSIQVVELGLVASHMLGCSMAVLGIIPMVILLHNRIAVLGIILVHNRIAVLGIILVHNRIAVLGIISMVVLVG